MTCLGFGVAGFGQTFPKGKTVTGDTIIIVNDDIAHNPFTLNYISKNIALNLPKTYSQKTILQPGLYYPEIMDTICTFSSGQTFLQYNGHGIIYACIRDNSVKLKSDIKIGDSSAETRNKLKGLNKFKEIFKTICIVNDDGAPMLVTLDFKADKLYKVTFVPYGG